MFRIPSHFQMASIDTDWAMNTMKRLTISGSVLDGLEYMNKRWEQHCSDSEGLHWEDDDHDFFNTYEYEVNAFNHCFQKFAPLFA